MASAHCLLKSLHFRASQLGHRASEDPAWPASSYACLLPCTCLLLPATLGFVAGRQSSSDEIDDDAIHACIMGWDDGCVHLGAHAPCVPAKEGPCESSCWDTLASRVRACGARRGSRSPVAMEARANAKRPEPSAPPINQSFLS